MKDFKEKILALELENLSETFFDEVENYIEILNRWNRVHNLTRMNKNEIYHSIFDSIFPLTNFKFQNFLDIGTGAGFPAIPIVMAFKSQIQNGFLVEPRIKRSSFLHVLKNELKLPVTIFNKRVEEIPLESFQNTHIDLITSRAVADTSIILKIAKKFLENGSEILLFKGSNLKNELEKLNNLNIKYQIFQRNERQYLLIKSLNSS